MRGFPGWRSTSTSCAPGPSSPARCTRLRFGPRWSITGVTRSRSQDRVRLPAASRTRSLRRKEPETAAGPENSDWNEDSESPQLNSSDPTTSTFTGSGYQVVQKASSPTMPETRIVRPVNPSSRRMRTHQSHARRKSAASPCAARDAQRLVLVGGAGASFGGSRLSLLDPLWDPLFRPARHQTVPRRPAPSRTPPPTCGNVGGSRVRERAGPGKMLSQGGDTGSNPVGTTPQRLSSEPLWDGGRSSAGPSPAAS
jgi:hypothetical protein